MVDVGNTLATWTERPIGINVNYLKDDDALRPKGRHLSDAVAEIGVGWIRYPGGEKYDWHLCSAPPYLDH